MSRIICKCFFFFLIHNFSFAQTCKELNDQVEKQYLDGQLEEAEATAIRALKVCKEESSTPSEYATSLNNMAFFNQSKGDMEKAKEQFNEALSIYQKARGGYDPEHATTLINIGDLYRTMGDTKTAIDYLKDAMKMIAEGEGKETMYADATSALANIYYDMGEYENARVLFAEIVEINKKLLGDKDPGYANCLGNLAMAYSGLGNYQEALTLYLKGL
ncbi:MAG: tetratricopeptide repeat protein, partial [Bacteroidia bacterium]